LLRPDKKCGTGPTGPALFERSINPTVSRLVLLEGSSMNYVAILRLHFDPALSYFICIVIISKKKSVGDVKRLSLEDVFLFFILFFRQKSLFGRRFVRKIPAARFFS